MTDYAVTRYLSQEYDILYSNSIKFFLESPMNYLYRELRVIQRNQYNTNQRIVLVDTLDYNSKQDFYNYLQKIIDHLDITNCFVMVLTNDSRVKDYVNHAHSKYSKDATYFEVKIVDLPTETINNPTNFQIPDTICIDPWIALDINSLGEVAPCCEYRAVDTTKSINDYSLLDLVNDSDMVKLKKEFLQGKKPQGCNLCWMKEHNGNGSKRLRDQYIFKDFLYDIDYNKVTDTNLISLGVALSNTCNLSCRSCEPSSSSKWVTEWHQNFESYPQWESWKNHKLHWFNKANNIWTDLDKISRDLKHINFVGGEPLLDKSHGHLLEYLISNNQSSDVSLHYNTNGTIYANHLIPLWNKFKNVELSFSIDNVQEKFEYERYGADWLQVNDIIGQYQQLPADRYVFNVYSTISILNILDSYDTYQFYNSRQLPVMFNMLTNPVELSITNFNETQKSYITNKLQSIQDNDFKKLIDPLIATMNQHQSTIKTDQIIKFLTTTDKIRKQNYAEIYQELASIFNMEE